MRQIPFDLVIGRTKTGGIGLNNQLPWKLPSDLKMFKKITTSSPQGNAIIMGRKTYQSIGKPLPQRLNIVISNSKKIQENDNLKQAGSLRQALQLADHKQPQGSKFVIGGSKVFQQAMGDCRNIYETLVADQVKCDTFVPKYPQNLKCSFISKTFRENNLRFDYRQYYNQNNYQRPSQNLFGAPQHEQYQYLRMVQKIIEEGEQKIDRTNIGTRALFGGMMRYDLSQSFPLLTHKKVFWRGLAQQILWFIKGSTNADQLSQKGIKIWEGHSSKQYLQSIGINRQAGDLGPIYGFQWRHWNAPYTDRFTDYTSKGIDQLAWIISQIKRNPSSRRLILSAWNPSQMSQMALPPCHTFSQFQVTNSGKLNCIMYQRSGDMGLGVPFNIASYSLLTCMIAQITGLERGQFVHMLGDLHVYSDHIDSLKVIKQIEPYAFPYLHLDPSIKNIDDFRFEHMRLEGYASHKKISMKMAV